jgi:anaerobic ribonucleoside-triphosphate reductase activating protein
MLYTGHPFKIHSRINKSRVNGPGARAVIWLQGCPFDCPGCFNPTLKNFNLGKEVPVEALIEWAVALEDIAGISISGGEPTEQIEPLNNFLAAIRERTELSVLLFSGRTEKEISTLSGGRELLAMTDVLIGGFYNRELANPPGMWPSSKNQEIRLLTDRYQTGDFSGLPETEIIISDRGEVVQSGLGAFHML